MTYTSRHRLRSFVRLFNWDSLSAEDHGKMLSLHLCISLPHSFVQERYSPRHNFDSPILDLFMFPYSFKDLLWILSTIGDRLVLYLRVVNLIFSISLWLGLPEWFYCDPARVVSVCLWCVWWARVNGTTKTSREITETGNTYLYTSEFYINSVKP